ncbi:MAG: hypothetical protein LBB90_08810, partial [Tannerella sp.]|nr:hypothetical protein [Tannerella sp.]
FCHPTTENARIPGYVSIFRRKYGEKQTRKWVVYFQTAPKINRQFTTENARIKLRRLYPTLKK